MDVLTAHRMVVVTLERLRAIAKDFKSVKTAVDTLVNWANQKLQQQEEKTNLEVECTLPYIRTKRKKSMPDELAQDEDLPDPEGENEIDVHIRIMATVNESIHQRFLTLGTLYADFALLDLKNFPVICSSDIPQSSLPELGKSLLQCDIILTSANLQGELKGIAVQWQRLSHFSTSCKVVVLETVLTIRGGLYLSVIPQITGTIPLYLYFSFIKPSKI